MTTGTKDKTQTGIPETRETGEETETLRPRKRRPQTKYRVRAYSPESDNDRVLFSHEDKGVARKHVETNYPRGREVYVEHPDGYREHYSADHAFQGSEPWLEFTEDED